MSENEVELPAGVMVKAPKSMTVTEVELTGQLVIVRALRNIFGEIKEITMVYKRVK
jgi:hypothetical protein